ncbi:MAG: SMP-30/gluconolactonase/LRE family protein [Pseudomonadota bacterium]
MTTPRIIARDRADLLGEGTLWSARDDAVYWTDILGRRVNRLTLSDDRVESWAMPDTIGWVVERAGGGLVAGLGRRIVTLTLDPLTIEVLADPEPDRPGNRMNDAKADAQGRIWAGTMPLTCDVPTGAFYRLDADHAITRLDDDYIITNGPAIGEDFVLHTDTGRDTIYRYPLHTDGTLGERAPFITFDAAWGHPDGMTLDADGGLWVACWGGGQVIRFTPDGMYDRAIALPASQITNCTFAGPNLDRMFVSSAADGVDEDAGGALFEVDPGCRGRPTRQFAG